MKSIHWVTHGLLPALVFATTLPGLAATDPGFTVTGGLTSNVAGALIGSGENFDGWRWEREVVTPISVGGPTFVQEVTPAKPGVAGSVDLVKYEDFAIRTVKEAYLSDAYTVALTSAGTSNGYVRFDGSLTFAADSGFFDASLGKGWLTLSARLQGSYTPADLGIPGLSGQAGLPAPTSFFFKSGAGDFSPLASSTSQYPET